MWERRLTKVFPNHLLTYVAAIVCSLVAGVSLGDWRCLPGLFLVQSWFPQGDIETSANPVAWSLSCELFFYLCFPFLLRAIRSIPVNLLWYWAGAVAGLVWCMPLIGRLILPSKPALPWAGSVSTYEFWFVYVFPPARLPEFVLGMLMACILSSGRWVRLPLTAVVMLTLGAYALAPEAPTIYSVVAVTVIPLALVIPAVAVRDLGDRPTFLRSRVMVHLGEISFAFYLWHRLVLSFGHRALGASARWPAWEVGGLAAIAFVIVLVLSWLTFTLVEQPAMRWISRKEWAWRADAVRGRESALTP
ncbi:MULTISPECIES: acyltransferase [unclassified Frankia]|nr:MULTISPECIES: acyltransferase [unclassified Frankia]